jgi:hypothetical protein
MDIVIPVRKGGLGNQMFQVAAGLIVAKEQSKTLVLPDEMPHIHNKEKIDYRDSIFKGFEQIQVSLDAFRLQKLGQMGFTIYPGEPGFEIWDPLYPGDKLILHGYFQNYSVLKPYEDYIRDIFRKNLDVSGENGNTCIGIHVRRGDFLQFSDVHYILDTFYYRRAIYEVEKRIPGYHSYKIFSDDIEWCKKQDVFDMLGDVEFVDEANEIECLKQMIKCEGGFICANSTFSWWAAFLGAYRNKNPCIVPSNWMKGYEGGLFPKDWIQISPSKGNLICFPKNNLDLHTKKQDDHIVNPQTNTVTLTIDAAEPPSEEGIHVYIKCEPNAINNYDTYLLEHGSKYNTILTFNKHLLEQLPNAKKFIFPACSWIPGYHYRSIDISKKEWKISCITGFKQMAEGHHFRHLLYFNQDNLKSYPITFFRSSVQPHLPEIHNNPFLYEDKFPLFETFQFSIVIENSSQLNYFTEKLIDCLITKTIPIYYGCPNIEEYFDTTGWILLRSVDLKERAIECFVKIHAILQNPNYYRDHLETVEKNYRTCVEHYSSFYKNINKTLLSLPGYT